MFFRTIYKPARFGGSCIEESTWVKIDEKEKLVWETEDCILCKEHCKYHENVIDWPLIEYPGKDRKCVGYCPCKIFEMSINVIQSIIKFFFAVDCQWHVEETVKSDCVAFGEQFFKNPM